jgi:hypothetical protein
MCPMVYARGKNRALRRQVSEPALAELRTGWGAGGGAYHDIRTEDSMNIIVG